MSPGSAQAVPAQRRRLLIGMYMLVTFLYWTSLYLYMPTLPTYAQTRTDSLALVGTILAQFGLWQAIARLPVGITSDWLGRRKPFIVAGIFLAGLGAYLMGTAGGAGGLLVGRAITGLAAATWVPLTVVFSSFFPADQAVRATSLVTVVGSVGRMFGTSVTGVLNDRGGYPLAFFVAVGAAGLALLVALPVSETRRGRRPPTVRALGDLVVRRDVILPSLLSAVDQYATWAVAFGFLPILASELGATGGTQSLLLSLHIGMTTLGSMASATLTGRFGARRLVYVGMAVMAGGIVGAALAPSLSVVIAAQFFLGLSMGINHPVLMGLSIRHVADEQRTTAMGLHQSVYAAGMFAGPWLSGILADALGLRPMLGITAFGCLVVALSLLRVLPARNHGT